jgi:hypothetical protein
MSISVGNELRLRKLFEVALPGAVAAGEPVYTWYVELPTGAIIDHIQASASTADGTDGFVANLRSGTTVLYTASVAAAATVVKDDTPAANQTGVRAKGQTLNVQMDFSGATTSENVVNPHISVWGVVKPR